MCCVMPPASVSTTAVERIASSSVVLPWSTWPMIVTTGGRAERSASTSSTISLLLVVGGVLDRHLALDLGRDQLDLLVRERLRRGPHLAEAHQDLDDLRHRHAERGGEVLDGDAGLDRDGPGRRRGRLRARGRLLGAVARSARVAAACRAALDHDAPAPASRAAAARADRAVRSVRAVSHQTSQCRGARARGRRSRRHAAPA